MELFIKPLEFEKTAYLRVSENPAEWTRDIMEQFYNAFPYFINYPVRVEFKQKDEQKGYAVGAIIVDNVQGLVVPIIIQNRELFPFDVCIYQGQTIPLSNYTINTYLAGKTPFMKTVKRETGDITTLLFSSGGLGYLREAPMETYKAASVSEDVSLLDQVLPKTTEAERIEVLAQISDERVAEGFRINGTGINVIKIASERHEDQIIKTADQASLLVDRDIWYIYKDGPFNYHGIFGNSHIEDPLHFDMTADDAERVGTLVKCAEHKKKVVPEQSKPVAILPIKDSDHSIVLLESGEYVTVPNRMYLDAPVRITRGVAPVSKPEMHKTGVMKLGEQLYSEPFEITHMWSEKDVDYVEGESDLKKYAFAFYDVDGVTESDGYTWLPKIDAFVKLGNEAKTIPYQPKVNTHRIIKTAGGLSIDGVTPVEYHAGVWSLIQNGIDASDVVKIAALKEGQALEIDYELCVPKYDITKIAAEYDLSVAAHVREIKKLARNFIKEASVIANVPTVDKVLALNFVNKDTINTFINSIPALEETVAMLSEMLVKARVGVQIADESAIRKVMFGVLELIEVLSGVKNIKA
jgi:hypothetical protein